MARARTIKPGFFTCEQVTDCSAFARLLFAGLWLIADREGRLEDRPRKIQMQLFAGDNVDCDALLTELDKAGLIARYQVEDGKYIQVLTFTKHQKPHQREMPSTIPKMDSAFNETGKTVPRSCLAVPGSCPAAPSTLSPFPSPVSPLPIQEPPSLRSGGSAREARDPPAPEPDDASRQTPEASKRRRAKPRQRFPDNWLPSPQDTAFAHQRGRDDAWIAANALHCRAHHVAKGTLTTDPAATWRTWVLQAPQFERKSTNGGANEHTGPATAHAFAAATVLAEREARLGADRPADRALLAAKRRPGDA